MLYIITGHSRGLGSAIAEAALSSGAQVRGLSRNPSTTLANSNLQELSTDLSLGENWQQATDFAFEGLDAFEEVTLIHNAGLLTPIGPVGSGASHESIQQAIQLNLGAVMAFTESFAQAYTSAKKRVLFISSGAGRSPRVSWSVYCATKAALDMYAQVFAKEQEESTSPIKIASLAPGVVDTDMQGLIRQQTEEDMPGVSKFVDMKENGQLWSAEEAASRLMGWLNSANFGNDILVDLRKVS